MKIRIALLFLSFLCLSVSAQKRKKGKLADFTITQTKMLKKTGTQLFLKQVISDARCPEGIDCIWAGEAQVLLSIYQNKKWIDEKIMVFSPKTVEDNRAWLSGKLGISSAKIKSIRLLPYPKDSIKIDPKTYSIKIEIEK
ncbi:hypothetical protein [Flavobacterium sp.]|uniref:hypothetical protein n=1 Tax=Flavobacterium sp. TaxID=239 RepID=UPI002627812C|nr:hypothetical protein [Flavobacterium sp.]